MHEPLTVLEKKRLAEMVEAGTPIAEICEVIGRDRWTTRPTSTLWLGDPDRI